ncbi:MAG TPA: hypothetical protein VFZ25_05910, partial [Chloroflexota bacterium]|nr:hypothetical protein [Chloroflexota bacterium]
MKPRRWFTWFGGFLILVLALATVSQLWVQKAAADGDSPARPTVQRMIALTQQAQGQLRSGDAAGARATGEAIEKGWKTIERDIARQNPEREAAIDTALDSANDTLASPDPSAAAASLTRLQSALGALDEDLANGVTAPASSAGQDVPVDQVAIAQQVRQLEAARSALDRGDLATARADLAAFHQAWPSIETQVLAYSSSAYGEIENELTEATADLSANPANL